MSCNNPFKMKVGSDVYLVPCRNCIGCRVDNRNYWTMRSKYEAFCQYKKGKANSFCTLTYTPENTPIALNGKMTLRQDDVQRFFKRCRKWLKEKKGIKDKLKYLYCGEMGGLNGKPHYHIIFFGLDSVLCDEMCRNNWREGITQSKALAGAMIRYTLKYMEKQVPYQERKRLYDEYGYESPFIRRSKDIGTELYRKMSEENVYINSKIAYAPKYYRDKYGLSQTTFNTLKLQFQKEKCKREKLLLEHYLRDCREAREFNLYSKTILDGRPAQRAIDGGLEAKANINKLSTLALEE